MGHFLCAKICCVGIDGQTLDEICAVRRMAFEERPISALIIGDCAFHTAWRSGDNRLDLKRFAEVMHLTRVETIDISGTPTIRADLHEPLPELRGAFDMVIDAGTMFCCFDVPRVWQTLLDVLAPGGVAFHVSGLTGYMGRSYYSFHPALFRDFYRANGFQILKMAVRSPRFPKARWWQRAATDGYRAIKPDDVYLVGEDLRFSTSLTEQAPIVPNDATILCAARRAETRPFTRPIPQ
jgi:hypothetical protein